MTQENLFIGLLVAVLIIGCLAVYWKLQVDELKLQLAQEHKFLAVVMANRDGWRKLYEEAKADWSPSPQPETIEDILGEIEGGIMSAKLVELIEVVELDGDGTIGFPHKTIKRYYTKTGVFVALEPSHQESARKNEEGKVIRTVSILWDQPSFALAVVGSSGDWQKGCAYFFQHIDKGP